MKNTPKRINCSVQVVFKGAIFCPIPAPTSRGQCRLRSLHWCCSSCVGPSLVYLKKIRLSKVQTVKVVKQKDGLADFWTNCSKCFSSQQLAVKLKTARPQENRYHHKIDVVHFLVISKLVLSKSFQQRSRTILLLSVSHSRGILQ